MEEVGALSQDPVRDQGLDRDMASFVVALALGLAHEVAAELGLEQVLADRKGLEAAED